MKKKFITRTILTVLFAAACAIITKATTMSNNYFIQVTPISCVPENVDQWCELGGTGCLDDFGRQLFLSRSSDQKTCLGSLQEY
jgi:hypothetical protein